MSLKPYSEAFFNTLEHLDNKPVNTEDGVELDNAKAGIESYYIEQAEKEGYIVMPIRGSAKYKITVKGLTLLNQMRLTKALQQAEKSSNRNFWIELILTIAIGVATIFIGIIPLFN